MIGVSGLFVRSGQVGGMEYLLYNLLVGLLGASRQQIVLFVNETRDLDQHFWDRTEQFHAESHLVTAEIHGGLNRFLKEAIRLPKAVKDFNIESMLFPNYFTPPLGYPARVVTIIPDLQYRHLPLNFSRQKRLWLAGAHRTTLRYADSVVALSEFVREDILTAYGREFENKVRVIHAPVDWARFEGGGGESVEELEANGPYVLSVASHYAHKNLGTLIRAMSAVKDKLPHHRLVLVGQLRHKLRGIKKLRAVDVVRLAHEVGIEKSVVVTGHVSDARLAALYRGADLFVLPSIFEGFGLPAVEALGMGVPTLTTRCGSLPEATRGEAVYLDDPFDTLEMGEKIVRVINDRRSFIPTADGVHALRRSYAPVTIGEQYLQLLQAKQ